MQNVSFEFRQAIENTAQDRSSAGLASMTTLRMNSMSIERCCAAMDANTWMYSSGEVARLSTVRNTACRHSAQC